MLTLGLWANSTWVGVPGLRETACGCDIVDSLIGETGRSLLQKEQPSAMLENIPRKCYRHFRAGRCVSVDSCTVLHIVRKISEKGEARRGREFWRRKKVPLKLNGANISSAREAGIRRTNRKEFFQVCTDFPRNSQGGRWKCYFGLSIKFISSRHVTYTCSAWKVSVTHDAGKREFLLVRRCNTHTAGIRGRDLWSRYDQLCWTSLLRLRGHKISF